MTVRLWVTLGLLNGAIPFAIPMGRLALPTDVRRFGDGNPVAANALRSLAP